MEISTLSELTTISSDTKLLTSDARLLKYQTILAKVTQDIISDSLSSPATTKSLSQQGILSLLAGYVTDSELTEILSIFPHLASTAAYKTLQVNAAGTAYQFAGPLSGKNLLINGNFDLWQRGTTGGPTSTSALLFAGDRWRIDLGGPTASYSLGQDYIDSTLSWYAIVNKTIAGGSNLFWFTQKIEEVRRLGGKTVCLSFWAKANSARSQSIYMSNFYGSGGSSLDSTAAQTISLTTDWAKYVLVFTLPTTVGKTIGAGNYTELCFIDNSAETFTWHMGRIQLEIGSVPTAFEFRQLAVEAVLCQRYFEKSYNILVTPGTSTTDGAKQNAHQQLTAAGYVSNAYPFIVRKRANPTMTLYSVAGTLGKITLDTGAELTASIAGTENNYTVPYTNTAGRYGNIHHYTADAEL